MSIWQVKNDWLFKHYLKNSLFGPDAIIYLQKQAIVNNMGKKCAVSKILCLAGWPDFGYLSFFDN
jgi:hypothetical protein